ncbi:hypothetical protein [Anaerocellum danielii]|uniref:Uncharacterized protein n=1 Tax=Anaerocellum danielii TaxID=1387557 RepID=A0ABZ0U2N4_9FIRM|nr:hypothetical protein [Caldicellulosiruptor danielii]WPX08863.1 hypothetical protein SOJ16_000019 [Caldicellulosiruptor danielii]
MSLSICPEYGRIYVSGGATKVMIKKQPKLKKDPFVEDYNRVIFR